MKITLITNLHFITHGQTGIRCWCSALLVEESAAGIFNEKYFRLRGFGPDGAWPVFDLTLPDGATWRMSGPVDSKDSAVMLANNGATIPLFSGAVLELSTGHRFFLQTESSRQSLDVQDVTAIGFPDVWAVLERKAEQYWDAPNMPKLRWASPRRVRPADKPEGV